MKEVEAITDINVLRNVPALLEKHYNSQVSGLWSLGVNVALRISDLITLKWSDISDNTISIKESKTGKVATIGLNENALKALSTLKAICTENGCNTLTGYVFPSVLSKGCNGDKPLTRQYIARVFKELGEMIGYKVSTHSMRKSRGYHLYKQTNDLGLVMKVLRHSREDITLRYIGITQETINSSFTDLNL